MLDAVPVVGEALRRFLRCDGACECVVMDNMPGASIGSDMVLNSCVRMGRANVTKGVVSSEVGREEQHFEVHHVINDNLHRVSRIHVIIIRGHVPGSLGLGHPSSLYILL